jgi:probable HAF family extracellular repeat protein
MLKPRHRRQELLNVVLLLTLGACAEHAADVTAPPILAAMPTPPLSALIVQELIELPVWDGAIMSSAADINDQGQVVGSMRSSAIQDLAILWENGAMQVLPTLGGSHRFAAGINNIGHVVGASQNASGQWRIALWKNGTVQDLGTLGGTPINALNNHASDINDKGQVVGVSTTASGHAHAFLWESGVMHDLGTLGGGTSSRALGINNRGQVVGFYVNSAFETRAFLWDDGVMQDLGTLGGVFAAATGINDLGQVVGSSVNGQNQQRAFLWEEGVMKDLGALGGTATFSSANGVNDLGQAVGNGYTGGGFNSALLAMDGAMYSLGNEMAMRMNNHGQVVGRYYNGASLQRAVIWTVPVRPPADLQPDDATNTLTLKRTRTVSLAISSNPWFNAQSVNAASVTLGDEQGSDTPALRDRKGKVAAVYRDIDRDGDLDLVIDFDASEMVNKGDLTSSTTKLVLLGKRTDGRALRAVESVIVVP